MIPFRDRPRHHVRHLAMTVALILSAAALSAQTTPPATHLILSPQSTRFLDSLALDAREHRIENGACVAAYAVRDSVLTLERLEPASYAWADSVTIGVDSVIARVNGPGICPQGMPTIHSHVTQGGTHPPSDVDRRTAALRGMWNFLLQVRENGWLLFLY